MKGRYDPKSKYYEGNKNYDDIEKIVFSDEDEEEDRKNIWFIINYEPSFSSFS